MAAHTSNIASHSADRIAPPRYLSDQLVITEHRPRAPIQPVARNFVLLTSADRVRENVEKAAKIVEKHRRRIQRLVNEGRIKKAQRQAYTLFLSPCARIVAANRALKNFRPRSGMQKPSATQIAGLIFDRDASDDLPVKATPKASGGYRVVCQYQLLDKARQHLVRLSFGALVAFADNQTGVPGAGIKTAVEKTKAHFHDTCLKYAMEADIKSCFDSIDVERVRTQYGIPHWVMEHIVTNSEKERTGKIHPRNTLTRREWNRIMITIGHTLPQGSPASSILAFGFLKPALEDFQRRFENRVVVVNYCDNFIILAPGPISLRAAMEYLSLVLKKHSADRFVLEQKSGPRRMSDGIDFVGHHFKRRKGCPVVNIPTIKKREFAHDLKAKLSEIKGPSSRVVCDRDARLDHLAKWLRGKLASFSMAPEAQFAAMWRARILTRYSMNAEIADLLRWIVRKAPDCSVPVRRRNACPTGIPRNFRASEVRLDAAVANAAREFTYRYLSKVRATVAAKEAYPC